MIEPDAESQEVPIPEPDAPPPETTGRFVVVFADGVDAAEALQQAGVTEFTDSRELGGEESAVSSTDVVFSQLGIAVVSAEPAQLESVGDGGAVESVSPELVHHVLQNAPAAEPRVFADNAAATWGIQATRADQSTASGTGIRVAVLDTGFDPTHPDFAGRSVTMQSFIAGEGPEDGHGHGTHCIGTACGPKTPTTGPRYGVAHGAEIFSGKVLGNSGSGSDAGIIAGIDWAIAQGCAVISMSLGADVPRVHPPYVAAGRRALDQGALIVAAAGNNATRVQMNFGFVGAPANSPNVMAVGALNHQLDVAFFSARTLPAVIGGQVDVAGPGYQVYSSWPMPTQYRTISGTSMATPHVSGLAALWAERTGLRATALWSVLAQESRRLAAPSVDVGGGMVFAP